MDQQSKIDVEIVKVFASAAIRAVKEQCAASIEVGPPRYQKLGAGFPTQVDVASFLQISAQKFSGFISLCYPRETFLGMIRSMTKETHSIIDSQVRDGAAELLNIIYGEVKQVLNQKGYALPMGIPEVLLADAAVEKLLDQEPAVIVPFQTQHGQFFAQIGLPRGKSKIVSEVSAVVKVDRESFPAGTRILVVDDMATMRKVVNRTLSGLGYDDIAEANDGTTAWDAISLACQRQKPFQLIISDWNMPNMKGIELLKKVRANPTIRSTPFILLTAESELNQIMAGIQAGANAYLLKPFTSANFAEKLKEVWKAVRAEISRQAG
ncbi:MAG: response regulator [Bacteriovoracia bacterium]